MGDGTKKNPYTREDVLRLIKENGGTAKGLDLSGKVFEERIDLKSQNLSMIVLDGADLSGFYPPLELDVEREIGFWIDTSERPRGAHLEKADLYEASLREAFLSGVHLERSTLAKANLDKAILWDAHLEEADLTATSLREADLNHADLNNTRLHNTNFEESVLEDTNLQRAQLFEANLKGARLYNTHLEYADLSDAKLAGAYLHGAQFDNSTKLHDVNWQNYLIGEEIDCHFDLAVDAYRRLKIWYTNAGIYDTAGKFFYREMEVKRKAQNWKKAPHLKLWNWVLRLLCGYGERPERVGISAAVVVFGLALIYFAIGTLMPNTFLNSLYYSAVSFIALGYGSWVKEATGWVKGLGAFEAFIGVFMMALFLVTFTRKMTR